MREVELEYRREIEDLQKAFGKDTQLTNGLKNTYSSYSMKMVTLKGGDGTK